MWDKQKNADLWRFQREEFAENAAWKKERSESSNIVKQFIKSELRVDYNSGAGEAAAGGAAAGGAATWVAAFVEASAGGAAASASTW